MTIPGSKAPPFGRLRALWRELGPLDSLLYGTGRLLARLSGGRMRIVKCSIVAQPVGRASALPLRPDQRTRIEQTLAGHPLVARFPRPAEVIARRYRDGAECVSATVADDFAGFIWWQAGSYEEDEVRCLYVLDDPARCVWDFDVHVEPRFRLGRTLARLWAAVDGELRGRGTAWSFSRISAFNAASLAAHARLGTVECGRVLFIVLGAVQLAVLPARPWLHCSMSPLRRPLLRLRPPAGVPG